MITTLLSYENIYSLLLDNGNLCACNYDYDNRPMNYKILKAHKGVDNEFKFKVNNPDAKVVDIDHLNIYATITDSHSHMKVFEKFARPSSKKGYFSLILTETDLTDVAPGLYSLNIVGQERLIPFQDKSELYNTPLFTNTTSDITLTLEVTSQGEKVPVPSIEINSTDDQSDWLQELDIDYNPIYWAGPYPANRIKNSANSLHTFAVYGDNFSGKLKVFATLDHTPPLDSTKYFQLNISTFNDEIIFANFSGITPFTIQGNFLWLKFQLIPDPTITDNGKITKILLRS